VLDPHKLYTVKGMEGSIMQNINPEIRRDRLSIILRILETACTPIKKTHILYQAGINYYQLSRYLDLLVREGMIEQVLEPYLSYRTTEKGHVLLKLFSSKEIGILNKGIMNLGDSASRMAGKSLLSEITVNKP
jgi:predicted transcriptional regulator